MAYDSSSLALFLFFFFISASLHLFLAAAAAASDAGAVEVAVIEDGYTVKTVIDGYKLGILPFAVMLRPGSSDLIILDSSGSAFYTVPFPVSKDSVVKKLSGTGNVGYADGEPETAEFSKPRSFAMDMSGNVYVADRNNNVIRKITDTGVSTIAGVHNKTGKDDGPVQNATFSNDFELVFVAEKCALLVSDHGNRLVRQIDLKADDCVRDSGSDHGVGSVTVWSVAVGVVVACIVGFVVGLVARPYIFSNTGRHRDAVFQQDMEALPNQSGEASSDTLLRHQKRSSLELTNSASARTLKQGDENQEGCDVVFPDCYGNGRLDTMIRTHIKRFAEVAEETTLIEGTLLDSSGLVKRRNDKL
ncbi:hypothetical protein TIFTF001_010881 [Ficus carica]|uniref:NHL repeat-containing protein n=1 Tax=Ficus carica TaxID=3494 RepID=A0AA87ZYW8_FICCA|nr:hypothetical protein TIFTF001_010881 [Ficus carica]